MMGKVKVQLPEAGSWNLKGRGEGNVWSISHFIYIKWSQSLFCCCCFNRMWLKTWLTNRLFKGAEVTKWVLLFFQYDKYNPTSCFCSCWTLCPEIHMAFSHTTIGFSAQMPAPQELDFFTFVAEPCFVFHHSI